MKRIGRKLICCCLIDGFAMSRFRALKKDKERQINQLNKDRNRQTVKISKLETQQDKQVTVPVLNVEKACIYTSELYLYVQYS